ncbi:ELM1/GtrOC1 family putative glycosyltransferase [Methylopila sp. M107]|uniref:ELM1/GtrOC1 family putative glycosyltransferase n=1 Tax=Methylopila sp. M107 TaxID=1101190 RepID=UPI000376E61E|nr:ELM1/GtrOC1 family putative glycosyltransferase [Methylopila sp. M107]
MVWVLRGNRQGDNAMIEAAAEASGLARRSIQLRFNPLGGLQNLFPGGSLFSLTGASRAALAPPWPSVVLTSGKRAVPAALWIKRASGGRTRLVHVGRPQAPLRWFDLVVTTPQYRLPTRSNVMICRLPTTSGRHASAVASDLASMPRPRLVGLVGGSAAPQTLDAGAARAFAAEALARTAAAGGSLLVATSPRTSRAAGEALRHALTSAESAVSLCIYGEGPNRYRDFAAAADGFLVTDDSVSMVVEAAATGRPVALFRLPARPGPFLRAFGALDAAASRSTLGTTALEALTALGLIRSNRDIASYMHGLESDGLLAGGDALATLAADELTAVGQRVASLAAEVLWA